jgi:hypothetical protein
MYEREIERATLVWGLEAYDAATLERYRREARALRATTFGNAVRGAWRGLVGWRGGRR